MTIDEATEYCAEVMTQSPFSFTCDASIVFNKDKKVVIITDYDVKNYVRRKHPKLHLR